jgi:4,5-DOPA dioxygenase extradiol
LYRISYPAPGDEALAAEIVGLLGDAVPDRRRGLDHGAWVPLRYAWPEAETPVLQVSLPSGATPQELFELGRALRPLRERDVLIAGSGGIVHNLRRVVFHDKGAPVEPWAAEFDRWVAERLAAGRFEELFSFRAEAPHASDAVPTPEHFDPIFSVLGAAFEGERARFFYEAFQYGNLSMRCFDLT